MAIALLYILVGLIILFIYIKWDDYKALRELVNENYSKLSGNITNVGVNLSRFRFETACKPKYNVGETIGRYLITSRSIELGNLVNNNLGYFYMYGCFDKECNRTTNLDEYQINIYVEQNKTKK